MKYSIQCVIIAAFCLVQGNNAAAQSKNFYTDTAKIREWFTGQAKLIDSTGDFSMAENYPGNGFSVYILPPKKYSRYFDALGPVDDETELPSKNIFSLWRLINAADSANGFVYNGLADSFTARIPVKPVKQGKNLLGNAVADSENVTVVYHPVVFYGEYKKLLLPPTQKKGSYVDRWYELYIKDKVKNAYLPVEVLGKTEKFTDFEKKKDVIYFFVPRKLVTTNMYDIYFQVMEGGDVQMAKQGLVDLKNLQKEKWFTIKIESDPPGCKIYQVPQDSYDIEEFSGERLADFKKNRYKATAEVMEFLEPYLLPDGPTNVQVQSREVNYVYFILYGNQFSEPLPCKPGPGKINAVKYKFHTQ